MTTDYPPRKWFRTNHQLCPICGRKGWCSISGDLVHCMRQASDRPAKSGGWLHRLSTPAQISGSSEPVAKLTHARLMELHRQYVTALAPDRLDTLARKLNVNGDDLRSLGIGRDGRAWTFPMYDGSGKIIGIHRRFPDGTKRCLAGSRLGLFVPRPSGNRDTTLICEGASDTAAARSLGYDAVGIPSAGQGFDQVVDLLRRQPPHRIVIVADLEEGVPLASGALNYPGIESALRLAERLMPVIADLFFALPPDGIKDLRQWVQATSGEAIRAAIDAAPRVRPAWINRAWRDVSRNRNLHSPVSAPRHVDPPKADRNPGTPRRPRTTYIGPTATAADLEALDELFGDTVQDHKTYQTMIDSLDQTWARRAAALLAKIENSERRADLRDQFEERLAICIDGGTEDEVAAQIAYEQLLQEAGR